MIDTQKIAEKKIKSIVNKKLFTRVGGINIIKYLE